MLKKVHWNIDLVGFWTDQSSTYMHVEAMNASDRLD